MITGTSIINLGAAESFKKGKKGCMCMSKPVGLVQQDHVDAEKAASSNLRPSHRPVLKRHVLTGTNCTCHVQIDV